MASLSTQITAVDNTNNRRWASGGVSLTSGDGEDGAAFATSTSEQSVTLNADITGGDGPGLLLLENRDATDSIKVGFSTGNLEITLDPKGSGQHFALLPLSSTVTAIFYEATANAPQLWFEVFER